MENSNISGHIGQEGLTLFSYPYYSKFQNISFYGIRFIYLDRINHRPIGRIRGTGIHCRLFGSNIHYRPYHGRKQAKNIEKWEITRL